MITSHLKTVVHLVPKMYISNMSQTMHNVQHNIRKSSQNFIQILFK